MKDWITVVLVGGDGLIVALIVRRDRKNDKQRGENATTLSRIDDKVERVDDRFIRHIEHHDR